jgi:hypothetical protein
VGLLDSISFRFRVDNQLILLVHLSCERGQKSPFPPHTITSFPYSPRFSPFSSASFAESSTAKTCALGEEDTDKLDIPRGRKALAFSESVYQLIIPSQAIQLTFLKTTDAVAVSTCLGQNRSNSRLDPRWCTIRRTP